MNRDTPAPVREPKPLRMNKSEKQQAIQVFTRVYDQITKEASGKRCLSKRARQHLQAELFHVSVFDYPADMSRLALLLLDRLQDSTRFRLLEDLEYLDAVRDIAECGESRGWHINQNLGWRWE